MGWRPTFQYSDHRRAGEGCGGGGAIDALVVAARGSPHVLGVGNRVRDLWRDDQRADRNALHPFCARSRNGRETTAAGLLAVVGIFDIVGTIASGALTDRVDPRILLAVSHGFPRGLSG